MLPLSDADGEGTMTIYHLSLGANLLLWVVPAVIVSAVIVQGILASRREGRRP